MRIKNRLENDFFSLEGVVPPIVLGIAGNSPGYLAQTGEIKAFDQQNDAQRPRALFPMFVRNSSEGYLSQMPFHHSELTLPSESGAVVQMEPELAVTFVVTYSDENKIQHLEPQALTLINDVTHRNKSVTKLAQKKNWGASCKGMARQSIALECFSDQGLLSHLRLCGFHQQQGRWYLCSQDVPVSEYNVIYQDLIDWLIVTINHQSNDGVMHNIHQLLVESGYPQQIMVAIGAPCYTVEGEDHQLVSEDQVVSCLYDQRYFQLENIQGMLDTQQKPLAENDEKLLWLHQTIKG